MRERTQKRLFDDLVLMGIWAEIQFLFRGEIYLLPAVGLFMYKMMN